jgi:hypothetical protein
VRTSRAYVAGFGTAGSLVAAAAVLFVLAGAVVSYKGWPGVSVGAPAGAVLVDAPDAAPAAAKPLVVAVSPVVHPAAVVKTPGPQVSRPTIQPASTVGGHHNVVPATKTSTRPTTNIKPSSGTKPVRPTTPTSTTTSNGTLGGTVDGLGSVLSTQVSQLTGTLGTITGGLSPGLGATVTGLGQTLGNILTGTTSLLGGLLGGGHTGHFRL